MFSYFCTKSLLGDSPGEARLVASPPLLVPAHGYSQHYSPLDHPPLYPVAQDAPGYQVGTYLVRIDFWEFQF